MPDYCNGPYGDLGIHVNKSPISSTLTDVSTDNGHPTACITVTGGRDLRDFLMIFGGLIIYGSNQIT